MEEGGQPPSAPANPSLLFSQSNLAWTQPQGFALASPAAAVSIPAQPEPPPDPKPEPELTPVTSPTNVPEEPSGDYQEVEYHWFYQKDQEGHPDHWQAFSMWDSQQIEAAHRDGRIDDLIATNGTRFNVRLRDRVRVPVYWNGPAEPVQRCSWFYKRETDFRFIPYSEQVAALLEDTYRECATSGQWNRRLELADSEFVVFYAPNSVYHYFSDPLQASSTGWSSALMSADPGSQPRYAYRGPWLVQTEPEKDEPSGSVQHLIYFVHGIGEFCDFSFRPLVDVVDDFRNVTQELVQTHYGPEAGRVEVLPISWHQALHTKALDDRLREITLPSIPKLRSFTNDAILDAFFYTSPMHSVALLNFVAGELNRLHALFLHRNPYFGGKIALAGHSLGSLILFDLLSHQRPPEEHQHPQQQQHQQVEQIYFRPECLFGLGSPLAVFLTVRGIYSLERAFRLPTCPAFFNIFHPYDPIAYRLEPLIDSQFAKLKPVLVPHHKGRKRIHLQLKDSLQKFMPVGADLTNRLVSGIKGAFTSIYGFARAAQDERPDGEHGQPTEQTLSRSCSLPDSMAELSVSAEQAEDPEVGHLLELDFGQLNRGRRIDYVLQERPYEIVNEYVFAITAHASYWLSEDSSLLMLRELFGPGAAGPGPA